MATHLVSCKELQQHLGDWVIFDCRHDLAKPDQGPKMHAEGHIPGALHAHVDNDLCTPAVDPMEGRHPLPEPDQFRDFLQRAGVGNDTQVVAYDDMGGAWAGRLWWLMRHYGHDKVALLDGGVDAWVESGGRLETGATEFPGGGDFDGKEGHMPTVDATRIEVELNQDAGAYELVDARAPERYNGEQEPIDPVAGHIPGALNAPFADNVDDNGFFHPPDRLREQFEEVLGVQFADRVAVYCGSGVTAAIDIFAMELAGMGTPALYPGSWSQWCQPDAERPVEGRPVPA